MSIVISSAVVVADVADGLSLDHPIIGWHNIVTASNIVADVEQANYPASNLANPATHLKWKASVLGAQYLTITTNEVDPIDYIAVAGHNFASSETAILVLGFADGNTTTLCEEVMLPDDGPAIFRFEAGPYEQILFHMAAGSALPEAAVVYVGKLLTVERGIYVGHTPMPHGRKTVVANNRSESGAFLGRIVLGEGRETTIPLSLISPDWYRTYMDPFLAVAQETPFFFAWRPESYPREVGYGWLLDDPMPAPSDRGNLIAFDLKVGGVV